MLEWLEVRLDVGCDKRLMYEYRSEPLKCDRDALKQEYRFTRIALHGSPKQTRGNYWCRTFAGQMIYINLSALFPRQSLIGSS